MKGVNIIEDRLLDKIDKKRTTFKCAKREVMIVGWRKQDNNKEKKICKQESN